MNELFDKICTSIESYNDLKISVNIEKTLNDASSVSDIINIALSSYSYLVKMLTQINEEETEIDIDKEISKYIGFVYDPNGLFTEGVFAFNNLDITTNIYNKFVLSGLKFNSERLKKENIDLLISDVSYINLILCSEDNTLSLENIKYLCDLNKIEPFSLKEE